MVKKKAEPTFANFEEALGDGAGFEDCNMDTMSIPFIRLLQSTSPQVKKTKAEFIPEAEIGQFVNTVNNKLYDAPLKIVIGKFERYFIEWGTGLGDFKAAHDVQNFELNIFPNLIRNEKNQLTDPSTGHTFADTYVYYIVLVDDMESGVCILSVTSTGLKEAKKLNRNLTHTIIPGTTQRALPYFMVWEIDIIEMSNEKGDWLGMKYNFDSFVSQPQLDYVVKERKALPSKTIDHSLLIAATEVDDDDTQY